LTSGSAPALVNFEKAEKAEEEQSRVINQKLEYAKLNCDAQRLLVCK